MIWVICMGFLELNQIFTTDFNIDSIACPYRSWDADTRYHYIDSPRRRHGLMLLTDHPALFEMPDGQTVQRNAGDLLLLPKGAQYHVRFLVPPGKQTHPVVINFRLSTADGRETLLPGQVVRLCCDDGRLLPLFNAAVHLYESGTVANLKAKVYELFDRIFPVEETDQCCIGYINRHYTSRFSVPELARRCAVSETVYRKQFRQLTGRSPVQYINRLKIEKACQMLQNDDIRLQEISDFLGFYSLPYFYKVFKDHMGITPHEYMEHKE
ncbi:MAG: AraC family transcriptional regulator [Ruminococcaceae bacterium]|nr:AraC family transcriptional regulator [Oscillospiraceae bacterium]